MKFKKAKTANRNQSPFFGGENEPDLVFSPQCNDTNHTIEWNFLSSTLKS